MECKESGVASGSGAAAEPGPEPGARAASDSSGLRLLRADKGVSSAKLSELSRTASTEMEAHLTVAASPEAEKAESDSASGLGSEEATRAGAGGSGWNASPVYLLAWYCLVAPVVHLEQPIQQYESLASSFGRAARTVVPVRAAEAHTLISL